MKADKKKKLEKQVPYKDEKGHFVKGVSGNPNGRPKKDICIPEILRGLLGEQSTVDVKKTRLEQICFKAITLAEDGDKDARNWIAERTEGKPVQTIGLEGGIEITIKDMLSED